MYPSWLSPFAPLCLLHRCAALPLPPFSSLEQKCSDAAHKQDPSSSKEGEEVGLVGGVCLGLGVLAILGLVLLSLSSNLPQTVPTTSLRIYVINQLATCATIRVRVYVCV